MSYHVYTTDGIILKRTAFGEANLLLYILTEELGLIMASARSARLAVSKLRPALQEYAYISVSVIHGKNGWKITNVLEKNNFYFDLPESHRVVLARIGSLLLKMITGESPHPEIFQTIKTGFEFLKNVREENISNFETLAVLRVLYQLGYVTSDSVTGIFLQNNTEWNDEVLNHTMTNKRGLIGVINKALKESQL